MDEEFKIIEELKKASEKGEGRQFESRALPKSLKDGKNHPLVRVLDVPDNPNWKSLFLKDEILDRDGAILKSEEEFKKKDSVFDRAFQFCSVKIHY
jgi:hypothetical protein